MPLTGAGWEADEGGLLVQTKGRRGAKAGLFSQLSHFLSCLCSALLRSVLLGLASSNITILINQNPFHVGKNHFKKPSHVEPCEGPDNGE